MSTLSQTQKSILQAAANREKGSVLPLPSHIKGGAVDQVLGALLNKGYIEQSGGQEFIITSAGREAIVGQVAQGSASEPVEVNQETEEQPVEVMTQDSEADHVAMVEKVKTSKPVKHIQPRKNSKKEMVVALLSRPGGALASQIIEATGWQAHTVRGFISVQKKAGLHVKTGRNESGELVYKIISRDEADQ